MVTNNFHTLHILHLILSFNSDIHVAQTPSERPLSLQLIETLLYIIPYIYSTGIVRI